MVVTKDDVDNMLKASDVFCMAPWVHQYFIPSGKVFPCCISATDLDDNLGDLAKGETLKDIWNSPATCTLRTNMLSGFKSKMCGRCYQYEELGKVSSRKEFNEMFKHHSNLVTASGTSGYIEDFNLKFIDFRFSNICNLTCRICSPHFSSKWHADAISLGIVSPSQTTSLIRPTTNVDSLWEQLVSLLDGLERIHFAGGEPLMMEEHYRILEYLISKEKTDVMITYNTNFSELVYKRWDIIEFWKQFKHISVCASLDGMGKRGELMRKGLKWDIVESNRKRMITEVPHVSFQLTPTVSIMNVLHLPDFFIDWIEKGLLKPEELNIYLLFEPYFYNIVNLSTDLKEKVDKKYNEFFNKYLRANFEKSKADYVESQFRTVLTHMHSSKEFKPEGIAYGQFDFASYNKKLDQLRNENFVAVFPELKSIL